MILVLTIVYILFSVKGIEANNDEDSVIILTAANSIAADYVVNDIDDPLNFTCHSSRPEHNVTWVLPAATGAYYTQLQNGDSLLIIPKLSANDSGEYKCGYCIADDDCNNDLKNFSVYKAVNIFVKKKSCLGFKCSAHVCIPQRYVCDGRQDCSNNQDENIHNCGQDPCGDKLSCSDGRCIPKEWCSGKWDVNCCATLKEKQPDRRFMRYDDLHIVDQKPLNTVPELVETCFQIAQAAAFVFVILVLFRFIVLNFRLHFGCSQRRPVQITNLCFVPVPTCPTASNEIATSGDVELGELSCSRDETDTVIPSIPSAASDLLLRPPPSYDEVVQLNQQDDLPPCYSSVCP